MAGHNPGSPTDFQYFYEDEVYKINNRGQVVFGLVLENFEGNSTDQESDVEDPVQKGEIRVVWHPSGIERVIPEESVGLADRSLMPGDVVRRLIAGKDTQRGYCRDIVMTAATQIVGTKHVIPNVASERLEPLEEFTSDLAVCLDSWVGTSKGVHSRLRLVSSDGSILEYPDLDNCPLEDYSMRRRREARYASPEFYPGQAVFGTLGPAESSKWLHITKEMKNFIKQKNHEHKFTVEAVVTESVSVQWQCRALSTQANEAAPQQPKYLVEGEDLKNLKLLNVFEPCTLQVGDRNYLQIRADDTFVTKKQWRKTQSKNYRNLRKLSRPPKKTDSKSSTFTERVSNSRPKKRCSSFRKSHFKDASISTDMELETTPEKIESLDDTLKDTSCPSIKIEPSGEPTLRMANSQEDSHTEEKNDSGISPEPNKEDSSFLNGDSKSSGTMAPDDDSENWENTSSDGSDTDSGATWSSRCSSVASRGKRSPQLVVRLFRGKRLKRTARRVPPAPAPRPGDKVVVETLHTTSHATVIWQDGTIETGIPSYQLYPIHHLDNQECFPGDFVVSGAATAEENPQMKHREYGVVQRVDHHGRTGIVNWYRTYTSADDPIPHLINVTEMSVYDLKDHPDFQYRPGTVVIRVANFTGEDANCTAGQVIDNFPSGRVKVWWVDGHTSMCWPQDLYKVGEYDSDEGELWGSDGEASEDSWETQSSVDPPPQPPPEEEKDIVQETALSIVPRLLEPRVAAHIERGRAAMRRLEELFHKHPTLQTQEIMRKLLNVYKDCRFLDKLMGTSFFHEDHFLGLLERVRERGANTPSAGERRVHDQLTRLFTPTDEEKGPDFPKPLEQDKMDVDEAVEENTFKDALGCNIITSNVELMEVEESSRNSKPHVCTDTKAGSSEGADEPPDINDAFENAVTEHDNRNVCQKLCSLIHSQLVKAHAEVSRRRPAELAEFLNKLMKNQNGIEENFPYHFSVQYGSLVVSMDALEEIEKEEEQTQKQEGEQTNQEEAIQLGEVKVKPTYETKSTSTSADIAPLAKAELADEIAEIPTAAEGGEGFSLLEEAPSAHRFKLSNLQPSDPKSFYSAIRREIKLLKSDLPPGVWVRGYENRMDLLSLMIAGPKKTPYEDGLFVFDVQLGPEYPRAPPLCHYHSYCCDRLNPNLYEDGKVCVSLLGTWSGRGVEVWGKDSSLLQVIVSLQGLILNAEPYFNEAGYEKQKGTQQGRENSRMYNEMVLLKLVQSLTRMLSNPPEPFRDEILRHLRIHAASLCHRLECWVAMSSKDVNNKDVTDSSNVTAKDVTDSSNVTAKDVTDSSNVTAKDVTDSSDVTAKDVTAKDVTDSSDVTTKDVTNSCNGTSEDVTDSNTVTSNNIDKVSNSVFNNIVADLKNVTPSSIVDVTIASDVLSSIDIPLPDFPLVPASRGFCLTLRSSLQAFRTALCRDDIKVPDSILL